ncbi:MAG: VWA domain-containing protein [Candidatus Solibacter usitatus]|nr:VWA domain-containing protein [Candidatus Solibacter usitatus]
MVDFTRDPDRIRSAIVKTGATQDGTSLYDAVARALCYMRSARRHRRVLLVLTDGADQHSHRSLEELIPLVQASQAQVFIVGYIGKGEYDLYKSSRNQRVTLVTSQEIDNPVTVFRRLANESGAESFFPGIAGQASGGGRCGGASTADTIHAGLLPEIQSARFPAHRSESSAAGRASTDPAWFRTDATDRRFHRAAM